MIIFNTHKVYSLKINFFTMKMFFSASKQGISNQKVIPEIVPDLSQESIRDFESTKKNKKENTNKVTTIATSFLLRYGMFTRFQNTSDCSSCGK